MPGPCPTPLSQCQTQRLGSERRFPSSLSCEKRFHVARRGPFLPFSYRALVALAVLAALAGCEHRAGTAQEEQAARAESAPAQVSQDVRFAVYNSGRPRAEIAARRMEQYETEDSTYTLLYGAPQTPAGGRVVAHLFDEAGDSSATITADRLVYREAESRFDARGQVVVETVEGKRLEGEHLSWNEAARTVETPGFVRITTPTDRVQGYGLRANEDLSNYRLANVTGETTLEDS